MKNPGLIIAALVLAALLGLLYWSNRHQPTDGAPASATPAEPAANILTLNEADINKIEVNKKGGDRLVITRDNNGKWQITSPKQMGVDEAAVSGMLSSIASLSAERLVEEKATNVDRYGLSEPVLEVIITDLNNTTHKLLLGDDTPTGSGAYVQLAGDSRVFTVASYTRTSIDKGLNDLRDKRLITANADKITRLELVGKGQSIEFSRDKEQWQILKPRPLRADGTKVDELVEKISGARMDVSDKDATTSASTFASGSAVAIARVTTDTGTEQLEVRKVKDDYYAKSSITDGVYKVTSDLGEALDKKLDDFRNKKLFDFYTPDKIEIHDGPKAYFLTKGGKDWWSAEGKKFDQSSAQALIDKLRELGATDFADSGFGSAVLEIVVTSGEGKPLEKVLLSKGNKNILAKRANEPAIYVLDAKAIEDLQKLLSELKT